MTADIHTLTGAYAADALDDDERRFFEQHLEACDACAQEVAELLATAARLGGAAAEPPPPDLKVRVLDEIDRTRQEAPRPRAGDGAGSTGTATGRPWWGRLLVPAAAVLVVLGIGVGVLVNDLYGRVDSLQDQQVRYEEILAAPDARWVETQGPDGSVGRVVLSPSRGEAVLLVDGMAPAPHEHTYELWVIDAAGATPAGVFDVDDRGRVSRVVTGDFTEAAAIGVTVEPEGGSPQPTSDPVMVLELGT
ncbi:anti-sigma factor domain-containing protein [Egicoccus sp. AB-alg2]|uniref:anti-sigma factor n=1 Tax=Egicoccus sp. AB-alg2 TaxID=3242693 RepID=UPI00359EF65D